MTHLNENFFESLGFGESMFKLKVQVKSQVISGKVQEKSFLILSGGKSSNV